MLSDFRTLDERYFNWLYSHVGSVKNRGPAQSYWLLCEQLFKTPFEFFVPNDHNRSWEGKDLREQFFDEDGLEYDTEWMAMDCSLLEMLLALAKRAAYQTSKRPSWWFWHLLGNLDIAKYTDELYHDGIRIEVQVILDAINRRTYDASGRGGLFPLRRPEADQREVELWYQLSAYLLENDFNVT